MFVDNDQDYRNNFLNYYNSILKGEIKMDKKLLTAPCGLDCFNCPSYEENITEEYKKQAAEFLKIPVEKTSCKGCRDEGGHCIYGENNECATWNCILEKGLNLCNECSDFPCKNLMPTQKGANFPHNMKLYNLCRIKLIGHDNWIKESQDIRKLYYNGRFVVGKGPVSE
jgi:hypothetical protein